MQRAIVMALAAAALLVAGPSAQADTVTPFPSVHSGNVFVIAYTVTTSGAAASYFAPGSTVVFRAYAVDGKTRKLLTGPAVKYFYVTVPNQPNVKLRWTPKSPLATGRYRWIGRWTVPTDYATGVVNIKVNVRTKTNRRGSFVQMPVAPSQLNISATPPPAGEGPDPTAGPSTGTVPVGLYADAVNGGGGAVPRPIGCTQTNVFRRGEELVMRAWGFDLVRRTVITMDNAVEAYTTVPGKAKLALNWGSHGPATGKVWYWTNAWKIPADYPLGDIVVRVTFKLENGRTGTIGYPVTIIP